MIGARSALVFTRGKPPGPARVAGGCGTSRKWKTKEEALGKCGTVKLLVGVSSGEVNLLVSVHLTGSSSLSPVTITKNSNRTMQIIRSNKTLHIQQKHGTLA